MALESGHPVVNPGTIRAAMYGRQFIANLETIVWFHARIMVTALFIAGHHTVILDSTNLSRERREAWKDPMWKRNYVIIDTPLEECISRSAIDPRYRNKIREAAAQYEPVGSDEYD